MLSTLLYVAGGILVVLGLIGVFTHVVGFGWGAVVVGAVLVVAAYLLRGRTTAL